MRRKAFTLAEVMITLTIIGVISAIVVPVAVNSRPDENVMKFKKAHNTLYKVINTLVTSDKYYRDGDLGVRYDGTLLTKTDDSDILYFCNTFADRLSIKKSDCVLGKGNGTSVIILADDVRGALSSTPSRNKFSPENIDYKKQLLDKACKQQASQPGANVTTTDGIVYYETGKIPFGKRYLGNNFAASGEEPDIVIVPGRTFSPPNKPANIGDENGFDIAYKVFCIDVDGIPANVTGSKCVNECPFGYGVRADGKILTGARADEWLKKSMTDHD